MGTQIKPFSYYTENYLFQPMGNSKSKTLRDKDPMLVDEYNALILFKNLVNEIDSNLKKIRLNLISVRDVQDENDKKLEKLTKHKYLFGVFKEKVISANKDLIAQTTEIRKKFEEMNTNVFLKFVAIATHDMDRVDMYKKQYLCDKKLYEKMAKSLKKIKNKDSTRYIKLNSEINFANERKNLSLESFKSSMRTTFNKIKEISGEEINSDGNNKEVVKI